MDRLKKKVGENNRFCTSAYWEQTEAKLKRTDAFSKAELYCVVVFPEKTSLLSNREPQEIELKERKRKEGRGEEERREEMRGKPCEADPDSIFANRKLQIKELKMRIITEEKVPAASITVGAAHVLAVAMEGGDLRRKQFRILLVVLLYVHL